MSQPGGRSSDHGPISGLQREVPSPIGGLHDGAGGTVYKPSRRQHAPHRPDNTEGGFESLRASELSAAACFFQAYAEPASRLLPSPDRNVVALRGYSLLLHVRDF
ncbi:hypothetical protein LEMLEM_LOCUS9157 [Lemmus lemmus]